MLVPVRIEVGPNDVQCEDMITIGGRPIVVVELIQLPGGAKQLRFESGELLTIHSKTFLSVMRMVERR